MASIAFTIPSPGPGQGAAVKVVWFQSDNGAEFTQIAEEDVSALTEVDGVYTWEEATAETDKYQLVKTRTAGGVLSSFGMLLPPIQDNPALQTLAGNVKEFGASDWSAGDTVTMTIERDQLVGGVVLEPVVRTATIDANGGFVLTPDKGVDVTVKVAYAATGKVYFAKSFVVSDDNIMNIKDY